MACRQTRPKPELVRLVRSENGVEIDVTAKKAGRGAYLCPDPACWRKALKGATLEKALRGPLARQDRDRLMEAGQKMLKELD